MNQVRSQEERFHLPWNFPFTKAFWGYGTQSKFLMEGDTQSQLQKRSADDKSLVISKLSKTYKTTTAVKEFSLTMTPGKVYAILGHNGAGKTSLIKMLSGVTSVSNGSAYLAGHSITLEMNKIQQMIGSCAQEDILWDKLTAREHIALVAGVRGWKFNSKKMPFDDFADELLQPVNLLRDGSNKHSKSFSGGMKRRLSLMLSQIPCPGQPLMIVFLDEPTTGMDPMNKQLSWKVIEKAKNDKIVVLTTHSME